MIRTRGSIHEPCSMIRILTYASLCTCLLNVSVLIVCVSAGRWVFGEAMCQIFAFISHVTVGGAAWLVALTGLERYYKLFAPAEHQCVFSDINTRIIVTGIYLLVAFVVTSPLYGWGEYTEYRGYFHITISLRESGSEDSDLPYTAASTANHSNLAGLENNDSATCIPRNLSPEAVAAHELNLTDFAQVVQSSLKMKWGLQARLWSLGSNITYLLRTQTAQSLQRFLLSYSDNNISHYLLISDYINCDCAMHGRFLCYDIHINLTEVDVYREIYLPFQAPMMCSVDFTTVNKIGSGWLAFFLLSTAIMPYGFVSVITGVILFKWRNMPIDIPTSDRSSGAKLLVGACISVILYSFYFIVNIANSYGVYISPSCHVTVLVFYFSCFLVPCIFCVDKNFLKRKTHSKRSPQKRLESMEDIEFELLQSAPV